LEIVEGIHQVDGVIANTYIIVNGNKLTLIDTGFIRSAGKIENYIKNLGFDLSAVSTIIITHFHIDHTGNAKKLKEATGAKVAVHEAEADFVMQKKPPPKPKNVLVKALGVVKAAPVEPDIILKDGDMIEGLQVIHVPGHSPGSIALLDTKRKVMFVGDAIFFADGHVEGPDEKHSIDMTLARESLGKLAGFDFEVMLSGHKDPLMVDASKKVKEFVETLKK
jgi:glyoxylase-like metal-dependent hydrolase (beta-lactamase superfamily II)